jgi:hypothetical protein
MALTSPLPQCSHATSFMFTLSNWRVAHLSECNREDNFNQLKLEGAPRGSYWNQGLCSLDAFGWATRPVALLSGDGCERKNPTSDDLPCFLQLSDAGKPAARWMLAPMTPLF